MSESDTLLTALPVMDTSTDMDMDDDAFRTGESLVRWKEREVQVLDLCKALWPLALGHHIHKRIMGTYNETIPATITLSDTGAPLDIIIRLPGQWGADEVSVIDQVAVLHHVGTSTPVRVPKVIAYDTTSANALESQYMIMERLRGRDLDELLDDMDAEQRKVLALELAELYHQLRQIRSPYSGRIIASEEGCHMPSLLPSETLSQIPIAIEPYGARVLYCDDWKERLPTEGTFSDIPEDFFTSGGLLYDPPNLPLLAMTARPFNRRLIQRETIGKPDPLFVSRIQHLRDMMDVIVDEGHVENPSNYFQLVHVDLFPRNIMVDPSSSPMITGIIDWDEAVFAPGFVADVAPAWLWEPPLPEEEEDDDDGEAEDGEKPFVDLDKESFDRSTRLPPTAELREVKRVWEEAVGQECVGSATDRYAILARRFLKIVTFWTWPFFMEGLYNETLEEFNKLRDEEEAKYLARSWHEDQDVVDFEDRVLFKDEEEVKEPDYDGNEAPEDDADSAWETCPEEQDDENGDTEEV
ncbi:hypothetical protein NKR19_g945 [Coniochaeta hoffmannii]|uniref:Aminoglycoside phosphotransferase domain-containing protein n=1 Tax=Coniochaeta hoffmannii TaxID=91930 RepID=A0AA38SDI9_9PEZI|nr:hypothetical protein NKR19_g945 [Coniochaeta hoffmannii]